MVRILFSILFAAFSGLAAAHGESHGAKQDTANPPAADDTAFGRAGDARKVARSIRVEMSDKLRFTPARLAIKEGETVKFVVKNDGNTMHEMVLGTMKELKEHSAMMKKHPTMKHDEPYMAHVAPGKTQAMIWQFTRAGEFYYGCLVPGHFEAGMVGEIHVLAKGSKK
jgi:uncharacterized cupredoxin-like copper-binding protein